MQIINPQNLLPNGTRINGIEYINQPTKPTTRVNRSALVVGDIWYKIDDFTEWRWNGTYWVSPRFNMSTPQIQIFATCLTRTAASQNGNPLPASSLLIETLELTSLNNNYLNSSLAAGTTSFVMYFGLARPQQLINSLGVELWSRDFVTNPFTNTFNSIPINTYVPSSSGNPRKMQFDFLSVGNTSAQITSYIYANLIYRLVSP